MTRTIGVWIESGRRIEQESLFWALQTAGDEPFQNDIEDFEIKSGERPSDAVPGYMTVEVQDGGGKPDGMSCELEVFLPRELSRAADIEQDRLNIKTSVQPTESEIADAIEGVSEP